MAEIDATELQFEVDPAAAFLEQEKIVLADLENGTDDFGQDQHFNNHDFDSFGQEPVAVQQNSSDGGLGDFEILGGGNDEFGINSGAQQYVGFNENISQSDNFNGPSNMYEAISQQDTLRAVPEKIKIWQEEQKARLEKKDAEEEKRKKELKEKAKKELEDWYKHHAEQLEKTRENNRKHNDVTESQGAAENAFIKDRDEKIPGQAWEKITRLCEFNPKNSKNTKDVSRFRSILLQLKQTPLVR